MDNDEKLISWYLRSARDLPWRNTLNPYYIWLSEIILQQTRVEQGMKYYLDFVESYPRIQDLAAATEDEVLKKWQGLGYYSRARNLLATAVIISSEWDGTFPNTYETIKALKGIGPYTAAAIASFAFKLPHAVVDGNVARVVSRLYDVDLAVNGSPGQKLIQSLADELLDRERPDLHNQAIMELGAMVCTPRNPRCEGCPFREKCMALENDTITLRPVKKKSAKAIDRAIDYAVIETDTSMIFKKRTDKDIWQGLHDFAEAKSVHEASPEYMTKFVREEFEGASIDSAPYSPEKAYTHILSHQRLNARFWRFKISGKFDLKSIYFTVEKSNIDRMAVPRLIHKYLEDVEII